MATEYTVKEYLESIALNKGIKSLNFRGIDGIFNEKRYQTMEEAVAYKDFWYSLFSEFKEDINKIGFLYQEKDKELPLSLGNKFLKELGFKVTPKIQEGKIKKEAVTSDSIRTNVPNTDMLKIITSEDEWKILNDISKNSKGFSVPKVYTLKPLCYQVNIPLENIIEVRFKSTNFLSKPYKGEQK